MITKVSYGSDVCVVQTALQMDHMKTFWSAYTPESTSQGLTLKEDLLLASLQARAFCSLLADQNTHACQ